MSEDGKSSIRPVFLLKSVYEGGRRFTAALAQHPFDSFFEVCLFQFAQYTGNEVSIRIKERGGRNRLAQPKLLHLIGGSVH